MGTKIIFFNKHEHQSLHLNKFLKKFKIRYEGKQQNILKFGCKIHLIP